MTISSVKAALFAAWTAALPSVQVINGPLNSATVVLDQALTIEDAAGVRQVSNLSDSSGTKQYTITCKVFVALATTDQSAVDDAAEVIWDAALAAVPALGLPGVTASGDFELVPTANDKGRACELTFPIAVFAAS